MSTSLSVAGDRAQATLPFYAGAMFTFLAASGAPTPLYRLYHEMWGVSPGMLTLVFSVYVLCLLAALLTIGKISDHVGRRPAVFAALLVEIVSMGLFVAAPSLGMLLVARAVQGIATGLATTSLAAAMLDADKLRGPQFNSLIPLLGMATGNLAAGALASYAPHPLEMVYALMAAVFVLQALMVWTLPETVSPRPGALASLRPQLAVPPQARRALLLISPANIAAWAWGGFYLSLMPSLVREVTEIRSVLFGCLVVSILFFSGTGGILVFRNRPARSSLLVGMGLMAAGVVILLAGVEERSLALMALGSVIGGFGFGAGFLGSLRAVMPLAEPHERAALMAVYYVESYLTFCIPAVAAGFIAASIGFVATIQIYGAAVIALSLAGLFTARKI